MSAVLGVPHNISGSVRITIPWPGRIQDVNTGDQDIQFMNSRPGHRAQADTIQQFLDGASNEEGNAFSSLALCAKALVLYGKADDLVEKYATGRY